MSSSTIHPVSRSSVAPGDASQTFVLWSVWITILLLNNCNWRV